MRDKIDEMFEILGNSKQSLILALIAYIIVMAIVIAIIWMPKAKDYGEYETIDIDAKKTEQAQSYINTITDIFRNLKKEQLSELISQRYINYTGKKSEEIISDLEMDGYFSTNVTVSGMNVYTDGDTYVYSTIIYANNNKRAVNIIERYPYKYEIVFDDFYSYDVTNSNYITENIKFTTLNVYRNLKYIEINMTIQNLNDVYARFDFSNATAVQVILEDGTRISLANAISSQTYTNIEPGMTVSKNFVFEVPAQLQEGIEYILFNGVNLEFSKVNIQFTI